MSGPVASVSMETLPPELRSRIEVVGGCWLWIGEIRKHDGRPIFLKDYAYRLTYEELRGPIPDGCVLHHRTCNQRLCVNPWHTRWGELWLAHDWTPSGSAEPDPSATGRPRAGRGGEARIQQK